MDIFISGCAKTRTTLVQWLFTAFKDCIVLPGECRLWVFRDNVLHYTAPETPLVAKRTFDSILSSQLPAELFNDQTARIQGDNIKLVRVKRNREDTLKSENGYVSPMRYDECERQAEKLAPIIDVTIDSDNVLKQPNYEQDRVAEALGLEALHKWSEWPDFAPQSQMAYVKYPKFFNPLGDTK